MPFTNQSTGEEFEDEDDYLRSLKLDDSYSFSYLYEYIADGSDDEDVQMETATLHVELSWDDSSAPGYVVSYTVESPTPLPNEWTGDADQLFSDRWGEIQADAAACGISSELQKDWPV